MKSKSDFTVRPSEAHDVLDPPATGRGVIGGQRFSGLTKALALFFSFCGKIGQNVEFVKVGGGCEGFSEGASKNQFVP
jgi:hypothetical protein